MNRFGVPKYTVNRVEQLGTWRNILTGKMINDLMFLTALVVGMIGVGLSFKFKQ
jgi:hypothetical protein